MGKFHGSDALMNNRHFSPYSRANVKTPALLQRIRGEAPQLHPPRLASVSTLTRE
jgi:hypothetical protein